MDFPTIIQARLKEKNVNKYRAALDAGLPEDAIRSVLDGHVPKLDRVEEICRALDFEIYIGPSRGVVESANVPAHSQISAVSGELLRGAVVVENASASVILDGIRVFMNAVSRSPFFPIDPIDTVCGPADRNGLQQVGDGWLRLAWLPRQGIRAELCGIGAVTDRDMEPTLVEDDLILVSTEHLEPRDGMIFMVRIGERPHLRRMRRQNNQWTLHADRPGIATHALDDAEVVGRVVLVARAHADPPDAAPRRVKEDTKRLRED